MSKTYAFTCKKCGCQEVGVRQTQEVVECFQPVEFDLYLDPLNSHLKVMSATERIDWRNAETVDKDWGDIKETVFYCVGCGEPVEEDEILIGKQEV